MENRLVDVGQNSITNSYIKSDDILKTCVELLNPHERLHIRQ